MLTALRTALTVKGTAGPGVTYDMEGDLFVDREKYIAVRGKGQ
jgi:hypothetical protein